MYNIDIVTQENNSDVLESWRRIIENDIKEYVDGFNEKQTTTTFTVDTATGQLEYVSNAFTFALNEATGCLEWEVIQNE